MCRHQRSMSSQGTPTAQEWGIWLIAPNARQICQQARRRSTRGTHDLREEINVACLGDTNGRHGLRGESWRAPIIAKRRRDGQPVSVGDYGDSFHAW